MNHSYGPPLFRRGEGTGGESSSKEGVGVRVAWLGSGVMVMASLRVSASLEVIMEVMSDMLKSLPGAGILEKIWENFGTAVEPVPANVVVWSQKKAENFMT